MCRLSRKAARLVTLGVSPAQNTLAPCLCRTGEENAEYIPTATVPNAMMYILCRHRNHAQVVRTTHIVHCTLIINNHTLSTMSLLLKYSFPKLLSWYHCFASNQIHSFSLSKCNTNISNIRT